MRQNVIESRAQRLLEGSRWVKTGLKFIDEPYLGLHPTTLLVPGADTGVGKTGFAAELAFRAACEPDNEGIRSGEVLYVALEEATGSIESRILWPRIVRRYYEKHPLGIPGVHLRRVSWLRGDLDQYLGDIESEVLGGEVGCKLQRIRTKYDPRLKMRDFIDLLGSMQPTLAILDYIQLLDLGSQNELSGVKTAMQDLRAAVKEFQVPVVALSQLRKPSRQDYSEVPDIADLHGSADIGRSATDVILMSRSSIKSTSGGHLTWFYFAKSRTADDVAGHALLTPFDVSKGCYGDSYQVAQMKRFSEPKLLSKAQLPRWALSAQGA